MRVANGARLAPNAVGPFYTTDECNGCGVCAAHAPINFTWNPDGSFCYVVHQPLDAREEQAVLDALEACPFECIRADGDVDLDEV